MPKILLVEDIPEYREYLREVLRDLGYTDVIEASNGQEALALLAQQPAQLVISDYMMGPVTGIALLRMMRQTPRHNQTPFIMMTAVGDHSTQGQAHTYGVTHYLTKPLSFQSLRSAITACLPRPC